VRRRHRANRRFTARRRRNTRGIAERSRPSRICVCKRRGNRDILGRSLHRLRCKPGTGVRPWEPV
jgi:hypothetical protein